MAQEYYYSSLTGPQLDAALLQATQAAEHAASAADSAAAAQSSALQAQQYAAQANGYSEAEADSRFAPAILCQSLGTAIALGDGAALPPANLQLLGRTTLSGDPAPSAPAQLMSIGQNITVTLNGGQDLTLTVAQPLRGIPMQAVCTKHNYTDTSGQKWFADEIDLARGVYIQRCFTLAFDGTEGWYLGSSGDPTLGSSDYPALKNFDIGSIAPDNGHCAYHMCSHFRSVPRSGSKTNGTVNALGGVRGNTLQFKTDTYNGDLEGWKQWLADQAAAGTPVTMLLGMKTPVETALSATLPEIDSNTTSVTNTPASGGPANMEMTYIADTKLYIDQKLAAISAAMLNN